MPATISVKFIVVFIPEDPYWLLATLRQAAALLNCAYNPLPMLILSRCPPSWLWQTLQRLVTNERRLSAVWAISSALSCEGLAVLFRKDLREFPSLEELSIEDEQTRGKRQRGLTKKELDVVLDLFRGYSIHAQARFTGVSNKTLYSQRQSGLKKIVELIPRLAAQIPRAQQKW